MFGAQNLRQIKVTHENLQ